MNTDGFLIQDRTRFSESLIWQLNRDFYQESGIDAWSNDIVPHQITSNSVVALTYAELIYAYLKDLAGQCDPQVLDSEEDIVYILELGAGHGRLGFHILRHLDRLVSLDNEKMPSYCYVLSDIVEDNLSFFSEHPQLQEYFARGILDISYFDAVASQNLYLRKSIRTIGPSDLKQPIISIANYFFDSIPNELFLIQDKGVSDCSVSMHTAVDPVGMSPEDLLKNIELSFYHDRIEKPVFAESDLNDILQEYLLIDRDTYIFFPKMAIHCLSNIKSLSQKGMVLLTMDKGYRELIDLVGKGKPDIVKHGSFSFWVNFHAIAQYCKQQEGKVLFPSSTNFSVELGCLLFTDQIKGQALLDQTYNRLVDQFNSDDFNTIKNFAYTNATHLKLNELLALCSLSAYDSTVFVRLMPQLKQLLKQNFTLKERNRLGETIQRIWGMYFNIEEHLDLAYELGGLSYDLGFTLEALKYFQSSEAVFGAKADVSYNLALCYYQLREDHLFYETVKNAKLAFPDSTLFDGLHNLNMS